jgi:hypothetical protein
MKAEIKSVFQTLSSVSIKDKIERKGNLDYLSWANAWSVLKANYPSAERKVYEHEHTGFNYFTDGKSAWVKVGIVVDGLECIDYLPIMYFRNNALPLEKVTSTDVNKAIQRSTAKAIAMHGLGLSLWTGEDVPEMTTESTKSVSPTKSTDDRRTLDIGSDDWAKVSTYVLSNKDSKMDKIVQQLSRKYIISASVQSEINKLHKV